MKSTIVLKSIAASIVLTFALQAQRLDVGSPAPELAIAKWLKGGPVDLAKAPPDQVTVIEFWASW